MPAEIQSYPINSQWVKVFYTTINPSTLPLLQPDKRLILHNYPAVVNYTPHTNLSHKSLSPESSQQGETPGCDYWNEVRRKDAMETCSLALGEGRHWKPWTQGTGSDIMQTLRVASCSGTPGQRVVVTGRVKWVGLPSNQLLRLWLREWNDRKPPPTTQAKKHKCKHTHTEEVDCSIANVSSKYGFSESC